MGSEDIQAKKKKMYWLGKVDDCESGRKTRELEDYLINMWNGHSEVSLESSKLSENFCLCSGSLRTLILSSSFSITGTTSFLTRASAELRMGSASLTPFLRNVARNPPSFLV